MSRAIHLEIHAEDVPRAVGFHWSVFGWSFEDWSGFAGKILAAGGTVALEKHTLPGMAWQGYFHDTENNVFGIHQPDPQAR